MNLAYHHSHIPRIINTLAGMQETYQSPTLSIGDWQLIFWRYAGCICRICCLTTCTLKPMSHWQFSFQLSWSSNLILKFLESRVEYRQHISRSTLSFKSDQYCWVVSRKLINFPIVLYYLRAHSLLQ